MKQAMTAKPADKNIQSGNSRVKVSIYGQVNRAIRFANTGDETEITSVDNDGSSSRIGVRAVGKANPNLTIGALHELEWQENRRSGTSETDEGTNATGNSRIRARHVDLWLDHKDIGQLWMGHGSIAGDAAGLFEMTGVSFVYGFGGANGTDGVKADASVKVAKQNGGDDDEMTTMDVRGKARGFRPFNFYGARENRIMYVTPSLMGARFRASYGENKSWSVGLRYAGAPAGVKDFKILFAAGYRQNPDGHAATKAIVDLSAPDANPNDTSITTLVAAKAMKDKSAWAVSGGVKHSSGFNVSASYDTDGEESNTGLQHSQWGVSLGWSGKVNDAGGTSIGLGYNSSKDGLDASAKQYWAAIVQKIDAAAADVYAGVSYDSGSVTHTVTEAEALTGDRSDNQNNLEDLKEAASPCYSAGSTAGTYVKAKQGSTCEVDRKGVLNFVIGVRLKF